MSLKYLIIKDKKRRKICVSSEIKKLFTKALLNETFDKNVNVLALQKYRGFSESVSMKRDSSLVRIKNRCILTGRAKSINRFYKLSRITLRELISFGLLPGLQKSSW